MDERLRELNMHHGRAENILCRGGDLEKALQLGGQGERYYPLTMFDNPRGDGFFVGDVQEMFQISDPEYDPVTSFFSRNPDGDVFAISSPKPYALHPNHLLNLPNTPKDVRFRQEGVRELVERGDLYNAIKEILGEQRMYGCGEFRDTTGCDVTPEKMAQFIGQLVAIEELGPGSGPLRRLYGWGREVSEDTLFQEIVRDKRRITDGRIFTAYTERFKGVGFYLLKPGVNPEDVFDILPRGLTERVLQRETRGGKMKRIVRGIVKFEDPLDKSEQTRTYIQARQRMGVLNEISAKILAIPGLLMMLQIKHLYQGAYMYNQLTNRGIPMAFPEILDDPKILEIEGSHPTRMVLQLRDDEKTPNFGLNNFRFSSRDPVIQAEGPSSRGKSEAWRTIHLNSALANAGYPIPARDARMGVVPSSHFITCKGTSGHGGSELERSLEGMKDGVREISWGDQVILDDFGDSTNAPTSIAMARALLPELLRQCPMIFITSHQGDTTKYVREELGGTTFIPNPRGEGVGQYVLVPREGPVDYRADETLKSMGFTRESVGELLPREKRLLKKRKATRREIHEGPLREEDLPF